MCDCTKGWKKVKIILGGASIRVCVCARARVEGGRKRERKEIEIYWTANVKFRKSGFCITPQEEQMVDDRKSGWICFLLRAWPGYAFHDKQLAEGLGNDLGVGGKVTISMGCFEEAHCLKLWQ